MVPVRGQLSVVAAPCRVDAFLAVPFKACTVLRVRHTASDETGAYRPNVAADMARASAACMAVASMRSSGGLAPAVAAVSLTLERTASTTAGDGAVPALGHLVVGALVPGNEPDKAETVQQAFDAAAGAAFPNLEQQAAALVAVGADGERLAAAIIALEACRHIPLVWHQANKLSRSFPDYSPEDLLGWGWQGLRIALRAYDPSRFAFSTYACTRIAGTIRDGVRGESPVPKRLATDVRKVRAASDDLTRELDRTPTQAELSDRLGMGVRHLELLARCRPAASIEELTAVLDSEHTPKWLGEEPDFLSDVFAQELARRVHAALELLDPDDAQAVRLLVMEGRGLHEAAELCAASPAQMRRRKSRGLDRLRDELDDWQLL